MKRQKVAVFVHTLGLCTPEFVSGILLNCKADVQGNTEKQHARVLRCHLLIVVIPGHRSTHLCLDMQQ